MPRVETIVIPQQSETLSCLDLAIEYMYNNYTICCHPTSILTLAQVEIMSSERLFCIFAELKLQATCSLIDKENIKTVFVELKHRYRWITFD